METLDVARSIRDEAVPKQSSMYELCPLNHRRDIRLLRLDGASDLDAPLIGALYVVRLDEAAQSESFVALSYTWEPPLPDQKLSDGAIYLENQALTITGNLDRALRRIRTIDPCLVWVDMICINQIDNDEKSNQVMLMFDIFTVASGTIMWLGEDPDHDAEYVLDLAGSHEGRIDSHFGHVKLLQETFSSRRYFHRRWVVQELTAALRHGRTIDVLYGSRSCSWATFKRQFLLAASSLTHISKFLAACSPQAFALSYLGGLEGSAVIKQLHDTQHLHCQDDRDRVYALSNLWQGLSVQVDYSLSCAEVYIHFILALFSRTAHADAGSLGLEIMAQAAFQQASANANDRLDALATWMPDWRLPLATRRWNNLKTNELSRTGRLEGFNGHHALTLLLTVYAVVYDAPGETSAGVVTSDGGTHIVMEIEGPSGEFLEEGDILCRPKLESDFNVDPDGVSMILRPHPDYTDVFNLVGRWKESRLPSIREEVTKKMTII